MGKKKQKVRWTAVEENFFNGDHSPDPHGYDSGTAGHDFGKNNKPSGGGGGGPPKVFRRFNSGWASAPLAPRFERRAAAAAAAAAKAGSGGSMTVFYDGDICETEQLPDGFTKIRSKNLDVLFKRDYYAHKIDFSRSNSDRGDVELNSEDDMERTDEEEEEEEEYAEEKVHVDSDAPTEKAPDKDDDGEKVCGNSDGPYSVSSYPYSPNAPPFVPSSQARPNLFLYSPSSNTMIPCEEIIIPNPVMGPEGPVYQGPSNIYLAFPIEGSGEVEVPTSSNGYIAQTFIQGPPAVAFDQFGVPYAPPQPYQPAPLETQTSVPPSEAFQSSSPSEGGTEPSSGESTTPHSPPDLSAYSPASWTNFDTVGVISQTPPWVHVNQAPAWYQRQSHLVTHKDNYRNPDEKDNQVKDEQTQEAANTREASVNHIPGLNPDPKGPKRGTKKRRKKRSVNQGTGASACNLKLEHRSSLSSEDPLQTPKHDRDECLVVKRILSRTEKDEGAFKSSVCSSVAASSLSLVSSECCDSKKEPGPKENEEQETHLAVKQIDVCDDEVEDVKNECNEPAQVPTTDSVPERGSNKKRSRKRLSKKATKAKLNEDFEPNEAAEPEWQVSFCEIQEPQEAAWETKKRKNRKVRAVTKSEVLITPEPEKVPDESVKIGADEPPVEFEANEKTALAETTIEEVAEEEVIPARKGSLNKKKKKRFSSQEAGEPKLGRQVLITDGLIDFGPPTSTNLALALASRRKSESQILEELEKARQGRMEKLFISSIGHGIQEGPLLCGRLGQGRYNPPDRSDEIPLKFRQIQDEECSEKETERQPEDLALD